MCEEFDVDDYIDGMDGTYDGDELYPEDMEDIMSDGDLEDKLEKLLDLGD